MRKGLWIGIGAAGLSLLIALWLAGGERGGVPDGLERGEDPTERSGEPVPLPPPEARPALEVSGEGIAPATALEEPAREPALPVPWAERPIVVHGTVVELTRAGKPKPTRPAAGLQITLKQGRRSDPAIESVTAADGSFRFELAPQEERPFVYTLRVAGGEGYRPVRHQRNLRHGHSETEPQLLRRVLQGAPHGEVVDRDGTPLGGVAIRCGKEREEEVRLFSGLDGTFLLSGREEYDAFGVEAEGYRLLATRPSIPRKLGGWSTGRFVLEATTDPVFRVVDDAGEPIEKASVRVLPRDGSSGVERASTDREGRARLAGICCDRPLSFSILTDDFLGSSDTQRGGELLFGESARGEPIVLTPGLTTELTARLVDRLQLVCRIANRGAREVTVGVRLGGDRGPEIDLRQSGPDTFTLPLPARRRGGPLIVTAREREPSPHRILGGSAEDTQHFEFGGGIAESDREEESRIAREVVDPARSVDGRLEVLLSLEPALSIRGTVVGSRSSRPDIWAIHPGAADPFAAPRESLDDLSWGDERAFVLSGLAPGRYDLVVITANGGWEDAVEIVPGILAGTSGLEIAMPATDEVVVQLIPEDEAVMMKDIRVLLMRHVSASPGKHGVSPGLLDQLVAWPKGLSSWVENPGWTEVEASVISETKRYQDRAVVHLPPTQIGDYRITVMAESSAGMEYAAVAGPLMRLTAGEHTLRYALIPTGEVKVDCSRIRGGGYRIRLHNAKRDDVPIDSHGRRELAVTKRRTLYLRRIPVGTYELRAGTPEELAEGRATWVVPVEVRADERTRVKVGGS